MNPNAISMVPVSSETERRAVLAAEFCSASTAPSLYPLMISRAPSGTRSL